MQLADVSVDQTGLTTKRKTFHGKLIKVELICVNLVLISSREVLGGWVVVLDATLI